MRGVSVTVCVVASGSDAAGRTVRAAQQGFVPTSVSVDARESRARARDGRGSGAVRVAAVCVHEHVSNCNKIYLTINSIYDTKTELRIVPQDESHTRGTTRSL